MTLQPRGYFAAAYFAHQAAEKALKAACWHVTGEEPPWNHRLGDVAERICRRSGPVPAGIDEALVRLDPLFQLSRYPSGDVEMPIPAELFGEPEALRAIEKAEEILRWVDELLRRPPERKQSKSL